MDINQLKKMILYVITYTALICVLLFNFSNVWSFVLKFLGILNPLFIGISIAFLISLPLGFIENKLAPMLIKNRRIWDKISRPVSVAVSFLFVSAIIYCTVMFIFPELIKNVVSLCSQIPLFLELLYDKTLSFVNYYNINENFVTELFTQLNINFTTLISTASSIFGNVVPHLVSFITAIFGSVINFILGIVLSIYLLLSKEELIAQLKKSVYAFCSPNWAENILKTGTLSYKMFAAYVKGQLTEAVILGFLCFLGMSIFGFEYPLLISALIAVTSLIPIFGAFIGTIPATFLLLLIDPFDALLFVIFIIVLQQLESNLIYPKVMGEQVGLPSIWVLVAILIGGSLFGITGMLIGIPSFSVIYTLYMEYVDKCMKDKGMDISPQSDDV